MLTVSPLSELRNDHYDGLRPESAARLQDQAREAWLRLVREFVPVAERMVANDQARAGVAEASTRVRIGMYFFSEPRQPRVDVTDQAADSSLERVE